VPAEGVTRAIRRRSRRTGTALLVAVTGAALAAGIALEATDGLRRLELWSVDVRFDVRGTQERPDELVVVGIDDATFEDLREQWPFPRSLHGRLVDRLVDAGARVIAYDVQFTEETDVEQDNRLVQGVANAGGRIVLSTTETDSRGRTNVLGGDENLRSIRARAGNTVMPADPNGVIRRFRHDVGSLDSFAVVAAELATKRPVGRERFGDDGAWIDFRGPPGTLAYHSFGDVLEGRVPFSAFRDKIVVVGAAAPSLQDVWSTSVSDDEVMSGAELQAEAISTILRDFPMRDPFGGLGILLVVGFAVLPPLASLRLRPLTGFFAALGVGAAFVVAAQLFFNAGWVLPVITPLVTLGLAAVGVLAVLAVIEAFERQRVRDYFAHFVPEQVVEQVLARTDQDLRLGGASRVCTVLFSDLRGFTAYAEQRPPAEVIEVLNTYLSDMSDAIMDQGGTLIAYMGDGIMAVFGAPLDQPDHADRALATARDMLWRLERFNDHMGRQFRMGIGINTGPVMCGNVGSERRLEYTAIGDTTNMASRLEGMTKDRGCQVLLTDSTREALMAGAADLVFVEDADVRGRQGRVGLWTIGEGVSAGPANPGGDGAPGGQADARQVDSRAVG
jgi:adenylate cyclase